MKGRYLLLLCLIVNVFRTGECKIGELYRTLNLTCYEEDELKGICTSDVSKAKIGCASQSVIEEIRDECAVLYQLVTPGAVCDSTSRGLSRRHFDWWSSNSLISPNRLSHFVSKLKWSLTDIFSVDFTNRKCFSASDILEDQGVSNKKCFAQPLVGELCSAIIDRLSRGESICDDDMFDDVNCVSDMVEQLFDLLDDKNDMLTLYNLIGNQLTLDHHRAVRDDHDHDHVDGDGTHDSQNCLNESVLLEEFNHVAEELGLVGSDGSICHQGDDASEMDTNCSLVYDVCRDLILETQLTTEACLAGNTSTVDDDHVDEGYVNSDTSDLEAYGYGFLSTLVISIASQLGVMTILFSYNNQIAKYLISLLIAVGVSSLVSDAILHLIPEAFGAHEGEGDGGHDHGGEEEHDKTTIWRGCCVLAGLLVFYLFELTLNLIKKKLGKEPNKRHTSVPLQEFNGTTEQVVENNKQAGCLNLRMDHHPPYFNPEQGFCHGVTSVAWMIILGDGIHNLADGIAIGASFTSSLGTGISTSLAVFFHEVPHEFGDFAILLSSGMKWYVALMYNFLSAVSAVVGMFIGVAIGRSSEDSTAWILSITAGVFLYVALVDLLPGLMEILKKCEDHRSYAIYMFCHLSGFIIGFVILLLIAIYEDDINNLVD